MSELREKLREALIVAKNFVGDMTSVLPTKDLVALLDELDAKDADLAEAVADTKALASLVLAHQERAEAAEGLIEQAVRALEREVTDARWHGEFRRGLSFALSLLKASRPQNREETE